jgi:hypothetical protein
MGLSLLWTVSLLLGALLFAVPIKIAAILVKAPDRGYGRCFLAALALLGLSGLLQLSVSLYWVPLLWLFASGLILAYILRTGIGRGYLVLVLQLPIMLLLTVAVLMIPAYHISLEGAPDLAALLHREPAETGFPAKFDSVLKEQLVGGWVLAPDSTDYSPVAAREVFKSDGSDITYFYDGPDCANVVREIHATWTIEHGVLISTVAAAVDGAGGISKDRILSVGDKQLVLRSLDDGNVYTRQRSDGCVAGQDNKTQT